MINLVEQLGQAPKVRRELVDEVKQKLEQGEYSTRSAAEQAAEAILRQS